MNKSRNIDRLQGDSRRQLSAWKLYPMLTEYGLMHCQSRLKDEGGSCVINGVRVYVVSKERAIAMAKRLRRSFVHRVYVICDCGSEVPFGRIQQHKCK
jgi:hypothetical protein